MAHKMPGFKLNLATRSSTLARVKENRTHAAKELGISIRTLRNKLREYRGMGYQVEAEKS